MARFATGVRRVLSAILMRQPPSAPSRLCVKFGPAALVIALAGCNDDARLEIPALPEDQQPATALDYEGSTTCRECHQSIYESWNDTRHNRILLDAVLSNARNDADGDGVNDFVQGGPGAAFDVGTSVAPDRTDWDDFALDPGVTYPRLGYDGANLLVSIGANTYPVAWIRDGATQLFLATIGNQEYALAVVYDPDTRVYRMHEATDWYEVSGDTLTGFVYAAGETPVDKGNAGHSWQRRSLGHAVTGVRDLTRNADGEYGDTIARMREAGSLSETNATCESCHGPSARHVDLGGGIGTALNPATTAANRADEACGQCHSRGESANAERFGFPWGEGALADNGFRPGFVLGEYQETPPRTDAAFFWANGARSARLSQQQWSEHVDSAHARAGVTCWQCHAPHGSSEPANLRAPATEICLSCHDGQGDIDAGDLSKHTRHADVRDCTSCHFVKTAGETRSHTYKVVYPSESASTPGLPNACAECHVGRTPAELTSWLRARWPDVKPVAYPRAAQRSDGAFNLIGIDSLDPLEAPLAFEWRFVSGPPSYSPEELIAPTGENAIFVPAQPGVYTFALVVTTDDGRRSNPAPVTVEAAQGVDQNPPDLSQSRYMGSAGCQICHRDVHDEWLATRHKRTLRTVGGAATGLFADSNGNGLNDWEEGGNPPSFNLRTDPDPDNTQWDDVDYDLTDAPLIGFDAAANRYLVTIGNVTYPVTHAIGGTGRWNEQYLVKLGEGDYVLPMAWSNLGVSWDVDTPENWYGIDAGEFEDYVYDTGQTPVTEGRAGTDSFQVRCLSCHVTGLREMTRNPATGEYARSLQTMIAAATGPRIAELGVGCESCHGPGSQHMTPSTGGDGSPSIRGAIVNPSKLPADRANEACAQCHAQGTSVNGGGFRFPWGSSALMGHYIPGTPLADAFTFPDENDTAFFWSDPDRHARRKYMEWNDFRWSSHFTHGGLSCDDCHVPHESGDGAQLRIAGNDLCLRCHQDIVDDQGRDANHSRHANGSRGNSCFGCHMPAVATATRDFDVKSHAFRILYPVTSTQVLLNEGEGIPNSCATAGCHVDPLGSLPAFDPGDADDNAALTAAVTSLFGDLRPVAVPRVDEGGLRRTATIAAPATIRLDGTQSYDPNGGSITSYTWTLVSAPAGNTAFLLDRLSSRARMNVTEAGTYVFRLLVKDATRTSRASTVSVVVE